MIGFGSTVFFDMKHIYVEGTTRYTDSEVTRLTGFHTNDNLLFLNYRAAVKNIEESLPYIKTAKTKISLPDTVTVTLTDRQPYAVILSGAARIIFDEEGRILERSVTADAAGLPVIKGINLGDEKPGANVFTQDEEHTGPLITVLNELYNCGMIGNVGVLDASESFNVRFTYLERLTVEVGLTEEVPGKLKMLAGVVDMLGAHERGILDLSSERARFIADQTGGVL